MEAIQLAMQSNKQLPIGTMKFAFNMSLYRFKNGKLDKCTDERILIGETRPFVAIHHEKDMVELQGGLFVKDFHHQNPTVQYGELEIIGETKVCSRNGIVFRNVQVGQKLRVKDVIFANKNTFYQIGKNEFISSKEAVIHVLGNLTVNQQQTIKIGNVKVTLYPNTLYRFNRINDTTFYLHDFSLEIDSAAISKYKLEFV